MKICILTPRFPFPENGGDVLRINNIARHLKKNGHSLVLVSFYEKEYDVKQAKDLYDVVYTIPRKTVSSAFYALLFMLRGLPIQNGYYYTPKYMQLLKNIIDNERPDMFISHLLRMAGYLEKLNVQDKSIIEMTDTLSKTYAMAKHSKGFSILKFVYSIEKSLIEKYELHAMKTFPKNVLVSHTDIEYLKNLYPNESGSLELHTNGVEIFKSKPYKQNKICFIGNMRTMQNQDAALHFAKDIFPIILKKKTDAQFYIIGAQPTKAVQSLHNGNNIFVTGFVDDLNSIVEDSCVAVAPVRIAAGIQNKVLVSMGMGIPVILSKLISEAIPELKDGENCFIQDNPDSFAEKCLELMDNHILRNYIGQKGKTVVEDCYSWDQKLSGYESLV